MTAAPSRRCASRDCPTPPTVRTTARCTACRMLLPQSLCGTHRDELTTGLFLLNVLSRCCDANVTLVEIRDLP